ncbi:hypothetical protein D6792_04100 [Candidatus Parcubacteria bacterium]|jgi:CRISPR/Cas system-associated exonuclease Cas4 (RecB family)|nr:MAG: hypothetical protein D6792_04100 [Candidatus Parcubacteria bacterium]
MNHLFDDILPVRSERIIRLNHSDIQSLADPKCNRKVFYILKSFEQRYEDPDESAEQGKKNHQYLKILLTTKDQNTFNHVFDSFKKGLGSNAYIERVSREIRRLKQDYHVRCEMRVETPLISGQNKLIGVLVAQPDLIGIAKDASHVLIVDWKFSQGDQTAHQAMIKRAQRQVDIYTCATRMFFRGSIVTDNFIGSVCIFGRDGMEIHNFKYDSNSLEAIYNNIIESIEKLSVDFENYRPDMINKVPPDKKYLCKNCGYQYICW